MPNNHKNKRHHQNQNHGNSPVYRQIGATPLPASPALTERGLASLINRKTVLELFKRSTFQEIEALFREAGYRSATLGNGRPGTYDPTIDREARQYLQSEHGRKDVQRKVDQLVLEEATRELATPAGRQRVAETMAKILAMRVSENPDVFTRACGHEVSRQVDRWLKSPAGLEAVQFEQRRAAQRVAGHVTTAASTRWVQQPLPAGGIASDE